MENWEIGIFGEIRGTTREWKNVKAQNGTWSACYVPWSLLHITFKLFVYWRENKYGMDTYVCIDHHTTPPNHVDIIQHLEVLFKTSNLSLLYFYRNSSDFYL